MNVLSFPINPIVTFLITFVVAQIDPDCSHPLGMQDLRIPDYYITSTSYHAYGTGPKYARLNRDDGDGAWCPQGLIRPGETREYLQIRLPSTSYVAGIATQGRDGRGKGVEYMKSYMLNYSRDGQTWHKWTSGGGVSILQGNYDTEQVKRHSLKPGIAATNFVRIIPITNRAMPVCARVELYGCPWTSGISSYNITAPDAPTSSSMLSDDTYDGKKDKETFTGGLGQLTDGVVGNDDVRKTKSPYHSNVIGYDYVGWSTKEGVARDVVLIFQFDQIKNLTFLRVHLNTDHSVGSKLFLTLQVFSSISGRFLPGTSHLTYNAPPDGNEAKSRFVIIPLHHVIAKYVKLIFRINSGKLLISEVEFDGNPISPKMAKELEVYEGRIEQEENGFITPTSSPADASTNIPLIVGVLIGVIVFLFMIIIGLYFRQRKLRKTLIPPTYTYRAGGGGGDHVVTLTPLISSSADGTSVAMETKSPMPIYQEIGATQIPPDNLYLEPSDVIRRPPPPPYQSQPSKELTDANLSRDQKGGTNVSSHYAEADLFVPKVQHIQGVSGNNVYAVPWSTPPPRRARKMKKNSKMPLHGTNGGRIARYRDNDFPPEFPRDQLEFVEKLGEGQFGEVRLCRTDASILELKEDGTSSISSGKSVLVAAKILRKEASEDAKEDFMKEVRVMSSLQHPNIVRLLAVCTLDEPFAMVTEYMEHGDLNQYLRALSDQSQASVGNNLLMKVAAQIASGMEYLSSLNFVHRDLAARNCLVGADDSIRIGDFGMSRNMYQSDYYRIQGRAVLPIRWMAWECILMGKFSSASDVWSFGVTLWEIFSLCKYQPFSSMDDERVIENMHHVFRQTGKEVHLPRPKRCAASLFNMIRQCWKRTPEDRPTFYQLHSYLLERQHTDRPSPKPKRPQVKPPAPKKRTLTNASPNAC